MTDLLHGGRLSAFEKRGLWGRAGRGIEIVLGHRKAAALGIAAAIGLAASVYFGIGYARYGYLAAVEQAAATRAERANADLQDALARLRDELGATNEALGTTQSHLAALTDEVNKQRAASEQAAASKADRVAQLTRALEQAQRELHLTEAQRVTLQARLSRANADLTDGQARQQQAQAGLDQWQKKIQQLTADRDKAAGERDQLRARLAAVEQQRPIPTQQQPSQPAVAQPEPAAPAPAAVPQPVAPQAAVPQPVAPQAAVPQAVAPQAAAPQTVAPQAAASAPAVAPQSAAPQAAAAPAATVGARSGGLAQFERVLGSAGVDVARLFAQYGVRTGEGGPFIPAPRGQVLDTTLSPEKLAALRNLVAALPISAPLTSYELGSPFGVRGDPINGHAGFHTGIDLLGPYMTPVYATAAGVVTFSGYRDDYGKVVEIDHGNGIATRYAHLHRAIVSVGQRVAAQTQIGFLGSTGRATGPHVHYEVLVNGEPQDPQKFLTLAHLVPAVQQ